MQLLSFVYIYLPTQTGQPFYITDAADQTILVVRNVRRTLTEFHHIMWDLQYVNTYAEALANEDRLFKTMPPREHFLEWRDDRVMGEIHWYGTYI